MMIKEDVFLQIKKKKNVYKLYNQKRIVKI